MAVASVAAPVFMPPVLSAQFPTILAVIAAMIAMLGETVMAMVMAVPPVPPLVRLAMQLAVFAPLFF